MHQVVHVLVDGHVAGQPGEGVGVAGGVDLHLGDLAHEVVAAAHAGVDAVPGEDEAVQDVPGIRFHDQLAQLVQADVVVHHQDGAVHQGLAGPLAVQLPGEGPGHRGPRTRGG